MKMKLFEAIIQEQQGEYEHSHVLLFRAATPASAKNKAEHHAAGFYGKPDWRDGNNYHFDGGEIVCWVNGVREVDPTAWMQEQFRRALVP